MNEINTATGNKGSTSDSKDGADATSVNTLLYSALNVLLLEAPSILRKKPADVDLRIKQLADLLEHCGNSKHCVVAVGQVSATPSVEDISSYASKAKLLAVRVPRLLVESKVERIAFRSQLLLYYQGHSLDRTQEQHSQTPVIKIKSKKNLLKKAATTPNDAAAERTFFESVLSKCPEILAGPSSTLARLFFAASYLRKPNTNLPVTAKSTRAAIPLTVDHVEELLNCNTKNFLLSLSELGDEESETLDRAYGKYLRALIEDLTPPSPGQLSHSVPAPSSEASTGDKGTVEVKEDLNFDDADDNANQTCLGSSGSLLSVDLGSSELERILCGVFNDLTAAAGITSDITVSAPTSSLNANIVNASLNGSKEVLSMTAEVQRLERTCEKVGSVLMKLAT